MNYGSHSYANETNFPNFIGHTKSFARSLAFMMRLKAFRKWADSDAAFNELFDRTLVRKLNDAKPFIRKC